MVEFDQTHFFTANCQIVYYDDMANKKLLPKQNIPIEQVPKKLSAFY